jgi:C4-type Zn-finger protein
MIEITKRGEIDANAEEMGCSCPGCYSEVKFEMRDSEIGYSMGYPYTAQIDCPVCGCRIKLGLSGTQCAIAWRDRGILKKAAP